MRKIKRLFCLSLCLFFSLGIMPIKTYAASGDVTVNRVEMNLIYEGKEWSENSFQDGVFKVSYSEENVFTLANTGRTPEILTISFASALPSTTLQIGFDSQNNGISHPSIPYTIELSPGESTEITFLIGGGLPGYNEMRRYNNMIGNINITGTSNSSIPVKVSSYDNCKDHSGGADCLRSNSCSRCGNIHTDLDNHSMQPSYMNVLSPTNHYMRYGCCGLNISEEHSYTCIVEENKLIRECSLCSFKDTITDIMSMIDGYRYYDGTKKWYRSDDICRVMAPSGYQIAKEGVDYYSGYIDFEMNEGKVFSIKSLLQSGGSTIDAVSIEDMIAVDREPAMGDIRLNGDSAWQTLDNRLIFEKYYKDDVTITILADDVESGIASIEYFVSNEALIHNSESDTETCIAELESKIDSWSIYTSPLVMTENNEYVVYVKITDHVGNVTYLSSKGFVIDKKAPVFAGIEDGGVYYGDKIFKAFDENVYPIILQIDGVDVTEQTEGDDEYKITADNREHTIHVVDAAGNITEYTITVYKIYTITFMDESGVVETLQVKHGESVNMPEPPEKEGYTVKWEKTIDVATDNETIKAVYTVIPSTEPPSTEPPSTEPPSTELPGEEPPSTEPPSTEQPGEEPPSTEPPSTELPGEEPPSVEPPQTGDAGNVLGWVIFFLVGILIVFFQFPKRNRTNGGHIFIRK